MSDSRSFAPTLDGLRTSRVLSAAEFVLAAAIVVGHNVFRVVPNEVPILVVLGMLSVRLRNGGFSALGFRRPDSWRRIVLVALAAAALRIVLDIVLIEPVTAMFWPPAIEPAGADSIAGNLRIAALALLLVWTFAAFGEEVVYRGYLITRGGEAGGGSAAAYLAAMVIASVLFGYGHYYKGPSGIVSSGIAGLILGAAYLLSGRNLWTCVLAHGFIDTVAVAWAFFGLDD